MENINNCLVRSTGIVTRWQEQMVNDKDIQRFCQNSVILFTLINEWMKEWMTGYPYSYIFVWTHSNELPGSILIPARFIRVALWMYVYI